MSTSFERDSAEILLTIKNNQNGGNSMETMTTSTAAANNSSTAEHQFERVVFKREENEIDHDDDSRKIDVNSESSANSTTRSTTIVNGSPLQVRENHHHQQLQQQQQRSLRVAARRALDGQRKSQSQHQQPSTDWESHQAPIHQTEIEVLASQELTAALALSGVSKQSAKTKEQQALLSRPLKESLRHLKNLLKLPKARRWVYCEHFYSDIDRELLLSENEFRQCLRESLPNLKTYQLGRAEWRQVRRLIGRPRRCSQAFFDAERAALDARRQRVRQVHRGEMLTMGPDDIDIPLRIPKPLSVGAKVHARVRHPKDGIYSGSVDAAMDGRYRIIFDKDVVMPLIVSDAEVMADYLQDLVSVAFFMDNTKSAANPSTTPTPTVRNNFTLTPNKFAANGAATLDMSPAKGATVTGNDPILSSANYHTASATPSNGFIPGRSINKLPPPPSAPPQPHVVMGPPPPKMARTEERCGNYPLRLIVMLVKLAKILDIKKVMIAQVQEMNREAERMHLYTDGFVKKFQEKYAKLVVDLERVNKQLEGFLMGVSEFAGSLVPQLTELTITSRPETLRRFCQTHAVQIVKASNRTSQTPVQNANSLRLINSLTSLLLQVRALGQQRCNAYELHSLQQSIDEIKKSFVLDSGNREAFQDHVEVHVKEVQFSMQDGETASLAGFTM